MDQANADGTVVKNIKAIMMHLNISSHFNISPLSIRFYQKLQSKPYYCACIFCRAKALSWPFKPIGTIICM